MTVDKTQFVQRARSGLRQGLWLTATPGSVSQSPPPSRKKRHRREGPLPRVAMGRGPGYFLKVVSVGSIGERIEWKSANSALLLPFKG